MKFPFLVRFEHKFEIKVKLNCTKISNLYMYSIKIQGNNFSENYSILEIA